VEREGGDHSRIRSKAGTKERGKQKKKIEKRDGELLKPKKKRALNHDRKKTLGNGGENRA